MILSYIGFPRERLTGRAIIRYALRMKTPVWLLDVDGVINANRPGWSAAPHQATVAASGTTWRMRWEPRLATAIRETHLSGAAEVRWATSWVSYPDELERVFRLPTLPLAFTDEAYRGITEAKINAALHVVETENRPLIWTDDEVIPTDGPIYDRLHAAGVPLLLIAPKANRGLRADDIDTITMFLGALS